MNKLFYPAIFHNAEEGGYYVTFPDFPECITEGDDLQNAYEMTVDALGLAITSRLHDKEPLPQASGLNTISASSDTSIVIVEFDLAEYNRKHNSRAVKKTLSIPEWMNDEALAAGINFSQVLQEALKQKLSYH